MLSSQQSFSLTHPFHAMTAHLGQMIRPVNGRSIVTKAAEGQFNKARLVQN